MGSPNFQLAAQSLRPPEPQPSLLDQLMKIQQYRGLQQDSQLRQQQLVGAQQSNQLGAQQLKDQQAITQAWKNWDGKNPDSLIAGVLQAGGSGDAAAKAHKSLMDAFEQKLSLGEKEFQDQQKRNDRMLGRMDAAKAVNDDQLASSVKSALDESTSAGDLDQKHAQLGYHVLQQSANNPAALRSSLDIFEKGFMLQSTQFQRAQEQRKTQAEETKAGASQSEADTAAKRLQAELPKIQAETKTAQANAAVAPQNAILGVQEKRASIASTQANTQKTKIETENLGQQPIFAVDPSTGGRVMTTRPEAQANGYTNPVPVKEGDVSKETEARAMINDVQLNKSRYLAAMQKVYREPITTSQKNALVALTPERLGLDIGHVGPLSIGFSLPDVIQKVANATAFSALSPAQKQAVVGYYSTLASVPAAQKALTNIGRANKEMMDLELRTIPTPLMDAESFQTMLDRFQGNIDQTSHKTVRIPGMPETKEIRALYEGSAQQDNRPKVNFAVPQPMSQGPISSFLGLKTTGQ